MYDDDEEAEMGSGDVGLSTVWKEGMMPESRRCTRGAR
jgi:hypothetical protein